MTLASYARNKGYTVTQFHDLVRHVATKSLDILETIKAKFNPGSGMYYPTSEIINTDDDLTPFVLQDLRRLGVEFIENGDLFRY